LGLESLPPIAKYVLKYWKNGPNTQISGKNRLINSNYESHPPFILNTPHIGKFHIIGTGWSPSVAAGPVRASHVCSDWCTVRRLDGWMRSLDVKLYILLFLQHVGCSNSLGVYGIWPGFCMFLTLCDFTGIMVRRENLFNNQSPFCFIAVNIIKPNRQMANKAQDKRWWVFEYIYI